MKVVAALYLVALNVNLQNGAGRSDAARYTLALLIHRFPELPLQSDDYVVTSGV